MSKFIADMHDRNIRIIGRGLVYISAAHNRQDIEQAVVVAGEVLKHL
ncbi:MAG: hypothetical protein M9904_01740 [Chitinophagaceae bacterium]|nr:hypothetical protein [Chitinophagaceae bacterium]